MSNSKLLRVEAEDFMGYKYFSFDFDETNIVSFKGYNSAGKTTILRALGVINSDMWAMKQTKFIRYGQRYFRISETFSDGVSIIKEKYATGKSSYTMFKDGEEIFSTIENGVYISVKGVPEFVKNYLNLVDSSNINLHLRRGRDKLLLVDTTGSENYEFLSEALKAQELSQANTMLKQDRLEIKSDVTSLEYKLDSYRDVVSKDNIVTIGVVNKLESADKELELNSTKKEMLDRLIESIEEYSQIRPSVALEPIKVDRVLALRGVVDTLNELQGMTTLPTLEGVETEKIRYLGAIIQGIDELNRIQPTTPLEAVSFEQVKDVIAIYNTLEELSEIDSKLDTNKKKVSEINNEINNIEKWLTENNVNTFRCKNCGELQAVGVEGHSH